MLDLTYYLALFLLTFGYPLNVAAHEWDRWNERRDQAGS